MASASLLRACEAGHPTGCGQAAQLAQSGGGGFAQDPKLAQQLAKKAQELGYKE
jgi:TPR repeat protein